MCLSVYAYVLRIQKLRRASNDKTKRRKNNMINRVFGSFPAFSCMILHRLYLDLKTSWGRKLKLQKMDARPAAQEKTLTRCDDPYVMHFQNAHRFKCKAWCRPTGSSGSSAASSQWSQWSWWSVPPMRSANQEPMCNVPGPLKGCWPRRQSVDSTLSCVGNEGWDQLRYTWSPVNDRAV